MQPTDQQQQALTAQGLMRSTCHGAAQLLVHKPASNNMQAVEQSGELVDETQRAE
jgi:hypothetical protein